MLAFVGAIVGFFTSLLSVFGAGHTTSTLSQLPELDSGSVQRTIQQATSIPSRNSEPTLGVDSTLEAGHEGPNTAQVALDGSPYVPGMSEYTDSDFGFSFWYPSEWTVTKENPAVNPWVSVQDATITAILDISSGARKEVRLEEVYSPTKTVTDTGGTGLFGPVTYWFDSNTHAWMMSGQPQFGAPSEVMTITTTADVSVNTMGGLHMLSGTSRFDTQIIPLSAHNFVIVSDGGEANAMYLARTVIAINPSVATPVSAAEQQATIQAEQQAYAGQ